MATSLASRLDVNFSFVEKNPQDLGASEMKSAVAYAKKLLDGISSGQADKIVGDTVTLADGGNVSIDLAGSLTDLLTGALVTLAKVKMVLVVSKENNTTRLTISRPASNGAPLFGAASGALASLGADGVFLAFDPGVAGLFTVVAATGDLLNFANSAGAVATFTYVVVGTSA